METASTESVISFFFFLGFSNPSLPEKQRMERETNTKHLYSQAPPYQKKFFLFFLKNLRVEVQRFIMASPESADFDEIELSEAGLQGRFLFFYACCVLKGFCLDTSLFESLIGDMEKHLAHNPVVSEHQVDRLLMMDAVSDLRSCHDYLDATEWRYQK